MSVMVILVFEGQNGSQSILKSGLISLVFEWKIQYDIFPFKILDGKSTDFKYML